MSAQIIATHKDLLFLEIENPRELDLKDLLNALPVGSQAVQQHADLFNLVNSIQLEKHELYEWNKQLKVNLGNTQAELAECKARIANLAERGNKAVSVFGTDHSDDVEVFQFAQKMKHKMRKARIEKKRQGWEDCDPKILRKQLVEVLKKGDPVDVANYCMMLSQRGLLLDLKDQLL